MILQRYPAVTCESAKKQLPAREEVGFDGRKREADERLPMVLHGKYSYINHSI